MKGLSPDSDSGDPALPVISQSSMDRILWPSSGSKTGPSKPESLPPVTFNDDLIVRVRASIEFAFHSAQRLSEPSFVHSVALYCPLPLGNSILDSMVKLIADQVGSDVVELDALGLVAGSLGAPNENILRSLYSRVMPEKKELDNMEQLFTTLINVPPEHGSVRRRVLYLRDLGSIAMSAKPLMSVLLRAVQNNRERGGASAVILVFGVSAKPKTKKVDDRGENSIALQDLVEAIPIMDPSSLLPSLGRKIRNPDQLAIDDLSPLSFAADISLTARSKSTRKGLFSSLLDNEEADNLGSIWSTCPPIADDSLYEAVDATMRNTHLLIIEPNGCEGSNLQLLQQQTLKSRVEAINRAMMRIIVRSNGACLSGDAEDFWVALVGAEGRSVDEFLPISVLPCSTARLISSIAIGLSSGENTSCSAPVLTPDHISRAYHLSAVGNGQTTSSSSSSPVSGKIKSVATKIAEITNNTGITTKERMFISRVVRPENLQKTGFLDVVIDIKVIETLRSIISLPLLHAHQFSTGLLAHEALSGILLYGPPGTGKTMVCRALAVEFNIPMLLVQPSDIFDMWLGESEKLAKAVFSLAHRIAPCIVFIDEVDALFGSRKSGVAGARQDVHRAMLTEFMQAMDGIQTKGTNGVVVIGATNRPFDLDTAILRRLPRRMMVDLPTSEEREKILKLYLRSETYAEDLDIHKIALITQDFSGSDLKNLCVSAALEAVNDSILIPPVISVPKEGPQPLRVIKEDHFARALDMITPSFSPEANAELYRWHEEYSGARQSDVAKDDAYQETGGEADAMATFLEHMAAITKEGSSG